MTQVVVMPGGRTISKSRPLVFVGLSLLMGVIGGINLGVGVNMYCYNDYYCDYRRRAYIISGSCFMVSCACFLLAAISMHIKIKKAIRMNETNPPRPPLTVTTYPAQSFVVTPGMQTQYPPPYQPHPGPSPYPLSPASQYQAPIGFAVNTQPTQSYSQPTQGATQPPPYVP